MDWRTLASDAVAVSAILTAVTAFLGELRKWRTPSSEDDKTP